MKFKLDLINSDRLIHVLTISIFSITFFILFVFEPFGDIEHGFTFTGIIRILSYSLVSAIVFLVSEKYLRSKIVALFGGSPYLALYWYFIELFIITLFIFLCRSLWVGIHDTSINTFLIVLYRVFSIAVIPFVILMLLLYVNNARNTQKRIVLKSNAKNSDFLKIIKSDLFYLKSEENYTTISYISNGKSLNKLLRGSLSFFHSQLDDSFIRIHRSYIVNLEVIKDVKLNSQGGEVILKRNDVKLKISRTYMLNFKQKWEDYYTNDNSHTNSINLSQML